MIRRDATFEYETPFAEAVQAIAGLVAQWFMPDQSLLPDLDGFEELVCLKNDRRQWLYGNKAYHEHHSQRQQSLDSETEKIVGYATNQITRTTDELILGGCQSITIEHIDTGADGHAYRMKTFKSLIRQNELGAAILTISRPIAVLSRDEDAAKGSLTSLVRIFERLGKNDQEICRLLAMGESPKDIADKLSCTTRTVEIHRQKIMSAFGVTKPIDIVKLMVRFADRGLVEFSV